MNDDGDRLRRRRRGRRRARRRARAPGAEDPRAFAEAAACVGCCPRRWNSRRRRGPRRPGSRRAPSIGVRRSRNAADGQCAVVARASSCLPNLGSRRLNARRFKVFAAGSRPRLRRVKRLAPLMALAALCGCGAASAPRATTQPVHQELRFSTPTAAPSTSASPSPPRPPPPVASRRARRRVTWRRSSRRRMSSARRITRT